MNNSKLALFLDRDGVINIDYGYVFEESKFKFIDGIFSFTKEFQSRGFQIFVITNQSGIARGYYGEDDFSKISEYMLNEFLKNGIDISEIYHCPHHPDFSGSCDCRKPKPAMIFQAQSRFGIDLKSSILVGDSKTDIQAGKIAGIKYNYLFNSENMDFDNILQDYLKKV